MDMTDMNTKDMNATGFDTKHMNTKATQLHGTERSPMRTSALFALGALTAVAGAAATIGAERIDRAAGGAELVAGLSLFASALLAVVVCLARTRIDMQREEIDRLRAEAIDAEIRSEFAEQAAHEFGTDEAADRFVVRESER
jgi:hypothetical protein